MSASLEAQLVDLGRALDVPETPDLVPAVMARIAPARARPPGRRWLLAIALALIAAIGATLAIPDARSAFLRILHIGGEEVQIVEELPPVQPQLNLDVALGPRTTMADAQRRFPFQLRQLDEKPDDIFFSAQTGTVWFLYGTPEHVRLLVAQTPASVEAGLLFKKVLDRRTRIEEVRVAGGPAYFMSGSPHLVMLLGPNGQPFAETVRLARNVLIWQEGSVAYRLEGKLTKTRAIELAESLH